MKGKASQRAQLEEIESALAAFPQRTSAHNPEAYIGGGQSKLRYLGLRVPHLHQTLRKGFSFSDAQTDEVAKVWDFVWQNSDCFEVMSLALSWYDHPRQRAILREHWPRLRNWSDRVDNWAHADTLSGMYARIHEVSGPEVYRTFQAWNKSSNPWLRRLSLVSLFYYSSQRTKQPAFAKVVALLEPQLEFDHYYVQKAVGWTLRELSNVYPEKTYTFMLKNLESISSIAFSAATEKMSSKRREQLKAMRKKARTHSSTRLRRT